MKEGKMKTDIKSLVLTTVLWSLATQTALAANIDLKSARGTVLIAAPTAVGGPTNQGIWFLNPSNKAYSLELPELPSNQVYEGWIVDARTGKKVSSGIFRAKGGIDSDAAGKFSGPLSLNFPQVPGSDFVTLGENLVDGGHNVVITIEPYPDTDLNPSGVVVLRANIPENTTVGTEITLENVAN